TAEHFNWDHAAMFSVNRGRRRFELRCQHQRGEAELRLPEHYKQPLDAGMLGEALRRAESGVHSGVIALRDTRVPKKPFDFVQAARDQRSALTVPLRLNRTIRWILDVQSSTPNAFAPADAKRAEELLQRAVPIFDRIFRAAETEAVLEAIEQGV